MTGLPPRLFTFTVLCLAAAPALAAGDANLDLTGHWAGFLSIAVFVLAYLLVMAEEFTHLKKSKPVILAAGVIWTLIALVHMRGDNPQATGDALRHTLEEYVELFLFLLAAMTYVNAMTERNVFEALRSWLVRRGFGYRKLFWITGVMAFFISPVLDNLTTALVLCAVALAVGAGNPRFVSLACINIVVAANAGGAFSPFGDITTLMVWQAGVIGFWEFFVLFLPCVVNYVIPAACMHFAVPDEHPTGGGEIVRMKRGGKRIMALFGLTIVTVVLMHNFLHLPPVLGMMTGLGYLSLFGFYLMKTHLPAPHEDPDYGEPGDVTPFDVFRYVARAEWDTLLFFYGVILCVGGLGFLGYLGMASEILYVQGNPTFANVAIGVLSAIVDNIPIMAAVLQMQPAMAHGQWLLVTLTAGVGGSLLSIGSAAGVALMGQSQGRYTFFAHLKWTWAIALGYAASIWVHLWINAELF